MFSFSLKPIGKVLMIVIMLTSMSFAISADNVIKPVEGDDGVQIWAERATSGPTRMAEPSTPIRANLSIDRYPPLGEPATLTCQISSVLDAPGVTATIELPDGVRPLGGRLNWQGDLMGGQTISLTARIVFETAGDMPLFCRALRVIDAENSWGDLAALYLSITPTAGRVGFAPIAPEDRYQRGVLLEPGDGRLVDEATVKPTAPPTNQAIEPPPPVDPSSTRKTPTESNTNQSGTLTVTGRWGYFDRDDDYTPALEFLVELVRGDNGDHLAWCYTDTAGYYSCGPVTNPGAAGVRTVMKSYMNYNPYGDILAVVNPDWGLSNHVDNTFGTKSGVSVFADGTHDIGSWYSENGSDYERAYWIQRDLNDVWRYIWFGTGSSQSPQETTGPATAQWKIDSTDGTYYIFGGNIHLDGDDPLSDTVVGHEYGHNIQYTIYNRSLPPAPNCNPHYINRASSAGCAWTEGWANFLTMAVNDDPVYRWSSGARLNLENPTWDTFGWDDGDTVEGHTAGALWDILDTTDENDDQYSDGGVANIWDTIYHQNDNTFSQYWSAWQDRGHDNSSAGPIMGLYQSTIDYRNGPPNDDFANAAFIGDLPYKVVNLNTINATTQGTDPSTVCGSPSTPKQSRSVWYRYTPTLTDNYTITTNGSNYDTVLAVWTGTVGALTNRGCDDDSGPGSRSSLSLTLNGGTTYYIEAMRYSSNSGGLLKMSVSLSFPPAPDNLQATAVSAAQIDLTWQDNSLNETNFRIERSPTGAGDWTEIDVVAAGVTSYSDTDLAADTTYYYRVRAYRGSQFSTYSNIANATTPLPSLEAPSNLQATAVSAARIDLTWQDNSSNETNFRIERSPTGTGAWMEIDVAAAGVTSYSDTDLAADTTYYYRVRAYRQSDGQFSTYANAANATTPLPPLEAPSNLQATAVSAARIDLTWQDNSSDETNFRIERSLTGTGAWTEIGVAGAGVTSYNDTGLAGGVTYYYRIRAFRQSDGLYSDYSSVANAGVSHRTYLPLVQKNSA